MIYILDACALIALFNNEQGADVVDDLMTRCMAGEVELYISVAQLLEVYYDRLHVKGLAFADNFLAEAYASPMHIVDAIPQSHLRVAGRLKVSYDISFADTFACAAAICIPGTLVTADGEFKEIERREAIQLLWLRPTSTKK
jgi:PIN domain nuclease of toxin-antitoxin system